MDYTDLMNEISKKRLELKELELQSRQGVCQICGKSYVRRTSAKYCDNPCPKDSTMTCKQYAHSRLWYQEVTTTKRVEKNVRSALSMRCKRNPGNTEMLEKYRSFLKDNKQIKNAIATGAITTEQYEKWLEEQLC